MGGFSGIDTDSIIRQLMYIERQPVRRMESDKQEVNNKIDAWQKINSSLDTLKTKTEDIEGIFAEMSTSSNDEEIITATADADATPGDYDLNITQLAQEYRGVSAQQTDSTSDLDLNGGSGGSFDITVDGDGDTATINVTGDDSLNDVANAINEQAVDGDGNQIATATVINNKLVIESAETGTVNSLSFTDTDSILGTDLGGLTDQTAKDAKFDLNGITGITRSSNTVDDVVTGMTFELKATDSATITVENNSEAMKEKIQAFVDQYNSVQGKFAQYGGKEGILQGDASLTGLGSNLYGSAIDPVEGLGLDKNTLSLIGIDMENDGTLSIDETELDDNLENNLEGVEQLFLGNESNPDKGIVNRIKNEIEMATDTFDGYVSGKIDSLEDQIDWIDDDISNLEQRLELREENLKQQFTRMEQAVADMNNQGSWLSGQISSMGLQ